MLAHLSVLDRETGACCDGLAGGVGTVNRRLGYLDR